MREEGVGADGGVDPEVGAGYGNSWIGISEWTGLEYSKNIDIGY